MKTLFQNDDLFFQLCEISVYSYMPLRRGKGTMSRNRTQNMTSGNYKTQIFFFGLPLLFGNILQQLYNFVDTVVVGRGISMNALAAVGTTGSINFLVLGFITGIVQGVSILAALFLVDRIIKSLEKRLPCLLSYACSLV